MNLLLVMLNGARASDVVCIMTTPYCTFQSFVGYLEFAEVVNIFFNEQTNMNFTGVCPKGQEVDLFVWKVWDVKIFPWGKQWPLCGQRATLVRIQQADTGVTGQQSMLGGISRIGSASCDALVWNKEPYSDRGGNGHRHQNSSEEDGHMFAPLSLQKMGKKTGGKQIWFHLQIWFQVLKLGSYQLLC